MPVEVTVTPAAGSPQKPTTAPTQAAPVKPAPVKPTAPAGSEIPAPAADATAKEVADYKRKVFEAEKRAAQEKRDRIVERRQWESEKKGLGDKLSRLSELEKREKSAKLNPAEYLRSVYGDGWYDLVVETRVNGGAPTVGSVELELQKLREDFDAKLKAKDEEYTKRESEAQRRQADDARRVLRQQGSGLVKEKANDYPLLGALPDPGAAIAQHIEEQFNAAFAANPEQLIEALTPQQAADAIEAKLFELVERAAGAEKYVPKLRERLTPQKNGGSLSPSSPQQGQPSQSQQPVQQERRTLSQAMTGSTPGERPRFRTDEERRRDAIAAFTAARKPPGT